MRILTLAEGDLEQPLAFSGTGKNLVDRLRAAGHVVYCGDVDLSGVRRLVVGTRTWSPSRPRWVSKYHTAAVSFSGRSRNAARVIKRAPPVDAILQIGATFAPGDVGGRPFFMLCDANFKMGANSPTSWAGPLRDAEIDAVIKREASVYARANAIFTLSERARMSFIEDFGTPPDRTVTVHAGPNFDPRTIREYARTRNTARNRPTLLFVGRDFERKGGDVVLKAFTRVRERYSNAELLIVGPSDLRVDLPGVRVLGLLRRHRPEEADALLRAYADADVFCFPTRFEPFGIVVLEAMFFGLPVVATNVWAIPEMVEDGRTGFIVPPDDPDAVATRVLTLLDSPILARQLGEAGRRRAFAHFTWEAVADRMTKTMTDVVGSRFTAAPEAKPHPHEHAL